jgi:hypothetical protein
MGKLIEVEHPEKILKTRLAQIMRYRLRFNVPGEEQPL